MRIKLAGLFFSILAAESTVLATDLDLALGYNFLSLTNPNSSRAYSQGFGGQLGVHYALVDRENFRFGLKASADYSELKNDGNTSAHNEQTKLLTIGAGIELKVYRLFLGVQYRYNTTDIELSGSTITGSERYRFYTPYLEIGYELPLTYTTLRFSYRQSDSEIPRTQTGFTADTKFSNSGLFLGVRFNFGSRQATTNNDSTSTSANSSQFNPELQKSGDESNFYSTPTVDTSRRNTFRPRPSSRLSY